MQWIAVDWGTSNLRAWLVGPAGEVLDAAESDRGMGKLSPAEFEPALIALVSGWLSGPTDVVVCGMAGARQGWVEAAYRPVPCAPVGLPLKAPQTDPRLRVRIVPGLSQLRPSPDVMRGEETQIAGVLAAHPQFDGAVCLPGTHTKWASISAGEVTDFRSFMTGEMFELLSAQSVLRHGMATGALDTGAFDAALDDSLARPEAMAARLFAIRAEGLLNDLQPAAARGRLSGILIGAELAAAKPWWLGREVLVVGSQSVGDLYTRALGRLGVRTVAVSASDAVLAGLSAAHRLWRAE